MMSYEPEHSSAISPEPADKHVPHQQPLPNDLGITAKPHFAHEWNGYGYTNAGDAITAARRAAR
jgi:hypothetical protein